MRKIVIVLITVFAVFAGTLLFVDAYMTERAEQTASRQNSQMLSDLAKHFDGMLSQASGAAESFLAGVFESRDGAGGEPVFYIRQKDIPGFPDHIVADLRDFLLVNPGFENADILVDDSISHAYFKGLNGDRFALAIAPHAEEPVDLSSYDFMHAESYNRVKRERRSMWVLPSHNSKMDGRVVIYYVPVECEDGSYFGTFAINLDISAIRQEIESHLPYGMGNSEVYITDEKGHIVASIPKVYEDFVTEGKLKDQVVANGFVDRIDSTGHQVYTYYKGERWQMDKRTVPEAKWVVYSYNKENAIYQDVNHLRWIIISISLLGMLLMLACCYVIFKKVHQDLRQKEQVEDELQMAAQVQTSILSAPEYEHADARLNAFLRPARDAGGDLYGYLERQGHLIFCIGDVSGKGMPAALFMTQVHSLFHDAARRTFSPCEICSEINDVLAVNNPDMTFCTFVVGVLKGTELTFCNAGHNLPVLLRKGEKPAYLKMRPHMPLGLMEGLPYSNETLELHAEDVLLLYTDGVTEAMDKKHNQFGEERLLQALSGTHGHEVESTLTAVEQFVGKYEQSDDITLLCVTHK